MVSVGGALGAGWALGGGYVGEKSVLGGGVVGNESDMGLQKIYGGIPN